MADSIGNISVPEIAASGTFPIVSEYPYGRASRPDVAIHQFGSGNAKIEQRFLLGTGARRFTVRRTWMNDTQRLALRNFWESKYGPLGAFTYNAPNDDGNGTTALTCRFANEPLSWQMVAEWACSVGVTLVEIPSSAPAYTLNSTVTRFPSGGLPAALLSQVQQVIPLIKIQPLQAGYPAIYLSDRRCTVGGQLYQARLIQFDGISQGMGNESDDASFTFGNADRVMRDLANDVDLYRAALSFSLFHVGPASSSISGRATWSIGSSAPPHNGLRVLSRLDIGIQSDSLHLGSACRLPWCRLSGQRLPEAREASPPLTVINVPIMTVAIVR